MKPVREHATNNAQTYFVTSKTWEGRALFRAEPWAGLFFQNLLSHRDSYLLHEFVLMPDHFHLLVSPLISIEQAMQLIKGGFSYRAKKELGSNAEIWQRGFSDHRIRDIEDCEKHVHYIHLNPIKENLCATPNEYKYSSAFPGWKLDPIPQWLKPRVIGEDISGTAKAVPFQNSDAQSGTAEEVPVQNCGCSAPSQVTGAPGNPARSAPSQNSVDGEALKGHDFSRADLPSPSRRALAPEGGKR